MRRGDPRDGRRASPPRWNGGSREKRTSRPILARLLQLPGDNTPWLVQPNVPWLKGDGWRLWPMAPRRVPSMGATVRLDHLPSAIGDVERLFDSRGEAAAPECAADHHRHVP